VTISDPWWTSSAPTGCSTARARPDGRSAMKRAPWRPFIFIAHHCPDLLRLPPELVCPEHGIAVRCFMACDPPCQRGSPGHGITGAALPYGVRPTMSAGITQASNCSALRWPEAMAASRRLSPDGAPVWRCRPPCHSRYGG
jgi:hypothetical protein